MTDCIHTWTEVRRDERGSWCMHCGIKVWDVDTRPCEGCRHHERLLVGGSICLKRGGGVWADMRVTFRISEGSCWAAPAALSPVLKSAPQQPTE